MMNDLDNIKKEFGEDLMHYYNAIKHVVERRCAEYTLDIVMDVKYQEMLLKYVGYTLEYIDTHFDNMLIVDYTKRDETGRVIDAISCEVIDCYSRTRILHVEDLSAYSEEEE